LSEGILSYVLTNSNAGKELPGNGLLLHQSIRIIAAKIRAIIKAHEFLARIVKRTAAFAASRANTFEFFLFFTRLFFV